MRITESRLRRIIRETLAQMGGRGTGVTVEDVDGVLSALAEAPPSDWEGPTLNPEGLTALAKEAEPYGLLKAIKGWIQGISEEKRTPGMKEALVLIDGIADRVGFSIDGAPRAAGTRVEAFLNDAWDDEDEEEVGRVVTRDDVPRVLDVLTMGRRRRGRTRLGYRWS